MDLDPRLISGLALAVAGLSFLWAVATHWERHWRYGRIICAEPKSFMAAVTPGQGRAILDLPLVLYNDGAAARPVLDLRLQLTGPNDFTATGRLNAFRERLGAQEQTWATQFIVKPASCVEIVASFHLSPVRDWPSGESDCILKGLVYAKRGLWVSSKPVYRELLKFKLRVPQETAQKINSGQFLAYDNYQSIH